MAVFYLDTSALVKRYREERGSELLRELVDGARTGDLFCFSALAVVELTATLTRLAKGQILSDPLAQEGMAAFRREIGSQFAVLQLENRLLAAAVSMAEQLALRAGDAIHLATASMVAASTSLSRPLVVVASDRELLVAAGTLGFDILDPEAETAPAELEQIRSRS